EHSLERVIQIADDLGYRIRGLDLNFGEIRIRRVSKLDPDTKEIVTLDMLLVSRPIQGIWKTRVKANLEDGELSVVSREGLIALKEIAARPQDIADIVALRGNEDA